MPLLAFCCVHCINDWKSFAVGRTTPKTCPFRLGHQDLYLIRGSLVPPESPFQTASRSVPPFLQDTRTWPTDIQTHRHADRPRYSVYSDRPHPHLEMAAMRPNNNNNNNPLAVETHCPLADDGHHFVKDIRRRMTLFRANPLETAFLYQRISVAVHSYSAVSVSSQSL